MMFDAGARRTAREARALPKFEDEERSGGTRKYVAPTGLRNFFGAGFLQIYRA
jgi:hypothetical protein